LKSQYRVDRKKVIPSAHLSDDLGADSLDKVEMIMALEDEFGVEIRDVDAERIFKSIAPLMSRSWPCLASRCRRASRISIRSRA
jgi:acyl carrier protein